MEVIFDCSTFCNATYIIIGVIETKANVDLLESVSNVIMIDRHIDDIGNEINTKEDLENRPKLPTNESLKQIYERRLPIYTKLCSYMFTFPSLNSIKPLNLNEYEYWNIVTEKFKGFIKKLHNVRKTVPLIEDSFFLTLDIRKMNIINLEVANYLNNKYDALELRLDYFIEEVKHKLSDDELLKQLREKIGYIKALVSLPLIMTIRTAEEGGALNITNSNEYERYYCSIYTQLSKLAVFEYYDIEYSTINLKFLKIMKNKYIGDGYLILSKHYCVYINQEKVIKDLEFINDIEESSIIKIVLNEKHDYSIFDIVKFSKPIIKLKLGESGRF